MEFIDKQHHKETPISVLNGDGFHSIHKILARESSIGQSSRVYYPSCDFEGVPFRWEIQPGTPLNNPQVDVIPPPLSPPPSIQGLGLPLPNLSDNKDRLKDGIYLRISKYYKIKGLKKMVKTITRAENIRKKVDSLVKRINKEKAESRPKKLVGESNNNNISDLESVASVHDGLSLSSHSSLVSYNSLSSRALDSLRLPSDSIDGPFCCSPWNLIAILDEENTRIYYCRHHKTAFALEEDGGSFLSRILSRVSCGDQFSGPLHNDLTNITHNEGVPFKWEKHPGTPNNIPPENDDPIIVPPPAVQSLSLPLPKVHDVVEDDDDVKESRWILKKALFGRGKEKKTKGYETSFRYSEQVVTKTSSYQGVSCGPNWSKSAILVFARNKLKFLNKQV